MTNTLIKSQGFCYSKKFYISTAKLCVLLWMRKVWKAGCCINAVGCISPKWPFLHMCQNPKKVPFKENISSIHHCWSPPTHSAVIVFCWQCVRESFSRYMKFIPSTSWKCTHGNFWQTVEIYFMDCHKIDLKMLPTNSCDAFARSWWLTSSHWLQRRSSGSFKSRQKFSTAS